MPIFQLGLRLRVELGLGGYLAKLRMGQYVEYLFLDVTLSNAQARLFRYRQSLF
jgi:hypothetical protein